MTTTNFARRALLLAVGLIGTAAAAQAQPGAIPGGVTRPAFSPYLNLLRPNSPTYLNYYGLVRPQQQSIAGLNTLQTQIGGLNQSLNSLTATGPFAGQGSDLATGHGFGFQTQRSYFQTTGFGAGGGGGGAGGFNTVRNANAGGGNIGGANRQTVTPGRR